MILAVSSDVFAALNLYEQWAAAAYCSANNDSPNTPVSCVAGNCPLVQADQTNTLTEFQKYDIPAWSFTLINIVRDD